MKKTYLLAIATLMLSQQNEVSAQQDQLPLNVVDRTIQPDPEAGNLSKYGNYTLNYSTGQVGISVPLFELKGLSLKYPVSLSYDHQGIRVQDRATSAGMNWNLNAAGVITRTINGLPDDQANIGYNYNYQLISDPNNPPPSLYTPTGINDPLYRGALGLRDFQPDMFSFSFNGRSGKFFYYPQEDKFVTMSYSKLRIEKTTSGTGGYNFLITDENGYQYIFDQKVKTDYESSTASAVNDVLTSYYCQWYLTKILSPANQVEFELEYTEDTYLQAVNSYSYTRNFLKSSTSGPGTNCGAYTSNTMTQMGGSTVYTSVNTHSLLISKIKTPFEDLIIEYGARTDESQRINKMKLINKNNVEKQQWRFYHSYYAGAGKLKLDSLSLYSDNTKINGYSFVYNANAIPARNSKAEDYWGFAKGTSGTSLFPKIWYGYQFIGDVDRGANNNTQNGILQKIIYPTGGYTAFEFELNDFGKQGNNAVQTPVYTPVNGALTRRTTQNGVGTSTTSFTLSNATVVTVTTRRDNCNGNPGNPPSSSNCSIEECATEIKMQGPNGQVYIQGPVAQSYSQDLSLQPGTYTITITTSESLDFGTVNFSYNNITYNSTYINPVGGLRVKSITTSDENSPQQVRTFSYRDATDNNRSSGHVPQLPEPTFETERGKSCSGPNPANPSQIIVLSSCLAKDRFVTLSGSSNTDLFYSEGSPVVYDRVVETIGENGEGGKIDHRFSYANEIQQPLFPYPGVSPNNWKRGLPSQTLYYSATGTLVKEELNTYAFNTQDNHYITKGAKFGFYDFCPYDVNFTKIVNGMLSYESQWTYPTSKVERLYSPTGDNPVVQTTSYFYDNPAHIQPTRIQTTRSDGSISQTRIKYPQDYVLSANGTDPMVSALYKMIQKNMIATPIEQTESIIRNGQEVITGAVVNTFKEFATGEIYPWESYQLDLSQPFAYMAVSTATGSGFFIDARMRKKLSYQNYNAIGRPTNMTDQMGQQYGLRYGYNGILPVMSARNAAANQIYYNGFEETASGTVTSAKFGRKAWPGVFSIPGVALIPGNYLVSWWEYSSGEWRFQTHMVNHNGIAAINVGDGGFIDEVSVRPPSSAISTFIFEPSIGLTSKSQDNGSGMSFEFDLMGRLRYVKDGNGNIVKSVLYQIQGPQ